MLLCVVVVTQRSAARGNPTVRVTDTEGRAGATLLEVPTDTFRACVLPYAGRLSFTPVRGLRGLLLPQDARTPWDVEAAALYLGCCTPTGRTLSHTVVRQLAESGEGVVLANGEQCGSGCGLVSCACLQVSGVSGVCVCV